MSKRDRVARLLRQRRRAWVSALVLARTVRSLAIHTEVDRCRWELGMVIANKVERTRTGVRSWYRYERKAAA